MSTSANTSTSLRKKHSCITRQSEEREMLKARIFVIDDEEIVTEVIEHYLAGFGFTDVHCFNDSVEAIETLQYVQADLLLTDINMPGLGGSYLTKLAKKMDHLQDVPVIAITADTSAETQEKMVVNGFDRMLHKPVVGKELVMTVVEALESRSDMKFDADAIKRERVQKASVQKEIRTTETALRDAFRK